MKPLGILATGMVTAVGLDAASSCAAMRGRLDGFRETAFLGYGGQPLVGAQVPLPRNWIGPQRLARLAAGAVVDALDVRRAPLPDTALILCLPETNRSGAPIPSPEDFAAQLAEFAGLPSGLRTQTVAHGRPSGFVALDLAAAVIARGEASAALIVGADSYLTTRAVRHYLDAERILGPGIPEGFIPGEAAAALLVGPPSRSDLAVTGLGLAREAAFHLNPDGLPLRGDGMTAAYRAAISAAGVTLAEVEYRIGDLIGEQYFFKQSALAQMRVIRGRKEFQDLWSPAESLGNIGAAVVPLMVGQALIAHRRGYAPGSPVLIEASSDDGACGAAVLVARPAAQMRGAA